MKNGYFCQSRAFRSGLTKEHRRWKYTEMKSTAIQQMPLPTAVLSKLAVAFVALTLVLPTSAQDDVPILKTEATGAFVWGEDTRAGAVSSSIRDPLTGNAIHKLNHGGVEVSSRAGFEKIRSGHAGELLNFTATVVNNTTSELLVRQGAASVDGRIILPLPLVLTRKGLSKKERAQVWEAASMNCFASGFLPAQVFLPPNVTADVRTVTPRSAVTLSFVVKDPRDYSVLCAMDGCYPKGTIRFSVTVNATDFVFVWPGRTMVDCGK